MNRLVLASGNAGKLKELSEVLNPLGFELIPQGEFNLDSADETGLSFVENALLKARYASQETGFGALADDSGLCVDCLGGAPGIYSARFGDGTDQGNLQALLQTLRDHGQGPWPAHYHCTLVLVRHGEDPDPIIAQGRWQGEIIATPKGDGGFGYDPIFYSREFKVTAAELAKDEKNRISHRGIAAKALRDQLRSAL
ncbi:MAG: RdgB/HAM1 family non-canonical purine NTP pyrophosphatase [Halieaceae bacterium]|nr:RdgB/HAM1 family non-canonical purine NTP pyrophosphatase [Halieaceae bacterium]